MSENPLISARGLSVGFKIGAGLFSKSILKAVDNVSLDIARGSFFGLGGRIRFGQDHPWPRAFEGGSDHRGPCGL
ncbi:hypothetical protein [Pseudorhodobacter sp.]|uniref:hypothetical protein n=1 Tax=Pseudorhodobacter sp. TaxID=1934400 RepID=UPI002AFDF1EE|nr:hypothetical protein [Pseudorhodobacter sp.]